MYIPRLQNKTSYWACTVEKYAFLDAKDCRSYQDAKGHHPLVITKTKQKLTETRKSARKIQRHNVHKLQQEKAIQVQREQIHKLKGIPLSRNFWYSLTT